jgi:two-component system LytT family sensor kinase
MMETTSKRENKAYWISQLVGWGVYTSIIFLASYSEKPNELDWILYTELFFVYTFLVLGTHAMKVFFIRMDWLKLKLLELIPRVFVTSIFVSIFVSCLFLFVSKTIDPKEKDTFLSLNFLLDIISFTILMLFWNSIFFTIYFFQKSKKQELDNVMLESSKNEIELKNLRSQLNPHFLFNSLNSIRALIEIEPEKAKIAVTTLSQLLRSSLIFGRQDLITLTEELELVSNYLDLESIRFEERLKVTYQLDEQLNTFKIPPFAIQTLVENAIKHGISTRVEGGEIIISAKHNQQHVVIHISNSGGLSSELNSSDGIGIVNTQRRLYLQFGVNADFRLFEENNTTIAELKFIV